MDILFRTRYSQYGIHLEVGWITRHADKVYWFQICGPDTVLDVARNTQCLSAHCALPQAPPTNIHVVAVLNIHKSEALP